MTVISLAVVLAATARFDPSFWKGPEETVSETTEPAVEPQTEEPPKSSKPSYSEATKTLERYGALKESGYVPTDGIYDRATCRLGLVSSPGISFPDSYSFAETGIRTVTKEPDGNGGYNYVESTAPAPEPAVRPYGGYILISDGEKTALADPNASKILLDDVSGYTPAYQRDIYGHPLFKKDGAYFYYYTPSSDAVFGRTETFTAEDGAELTLPHEELPPKAGMVEAVVDTAYFLPIDYDYSYSSYLDTGGIYRYHELYKKYTVTNIDEVYQNRLDIAVENYKMTKGEFPTVRTEEIAPEISVKDDGYGWKYIDSNGNTLFEKGGKKVLDFSPDGRAVIVNWSDRITVIDKSGKTVVDPYPDYVYLEEAENPLRDVYKLPDTYGIESMGMFKFDSGALRIRRRLVDTGNNNYVKSETQILISPNGKIISYPRSYELVGYSEGLMLLKKNGYYGYMDIYGNWIVKPFYNYAEPFSEGLAAVGINGTSYGMIDKTGKVVIPVIFRYVSSCSSGTVVTYSDEGGWTVFRKMTSAAPETPVNPVILRTKKDEALAEHKKEKLVEEVIKAAEKEAAEAVEKMKAEETAAALPEETAQIGSVDIPVETTGSTPQTELVYPR